MSSPSNISNAACREGIFFVPPGGSTSPKEDNRYDNHNERSTKCGVYISSEALLEKHREMVEAYPDASVIRLSVSEFDWVARAEKRGMRVA